MSKPRSAVVDYAVYVLVRVIVCLIQMLSLRASLSLARGLAWLVYHVDKRHRVVALENLRQAFPGRWTEAELDRLVRGVYRHFCTMALEIVHIPRKLHAHTWRRYLDLDTENGQPVVDALLSQRPVLFVNGHFGNWELAGYSLGLFGFKCYAIARPLDNPFVDDFLRAFRERTGQKLLAKHGDFDRIQEILSQGGVLSTLADQDAGARGLFVDFFGRPASTHKAVALLALQHRVPVVVTGACKVGEPMHYAMQVVDFILPEEYEGKPDAMRNMTQRFTTALERLIRRFPEQYFWVHRRWKHQPAKARRRVA
jgi:KDO2-lipid IV(A) lauroyltransferase